MGKSAMIRPITTAIVLPLCLALTASCAQAPDSSTYSTAQAGQAQTVVYGEVTALRPVEIKNGETRTGLISGALIGGIAGAALGGDTAGSIFGGLLGAVAGGAAGNAIQGSQTQAGVEITIKLDSGGTVAIVQPGDINEFRPGDRVRVVGDAHNARVTR
jgi:outer membrane lipoprotein SlyB